MDRKTILSILLFLFSGYFHLSGQSQFRKALFLGNSYTYVNNLPGLTAALAHSSGDSLFFDTYAPGGYTLGWQPTKHATDPISLAKIRSNNWDFVILQEQSQTPAITRLRDSCMFPASIVLHDSIKAANPCTRVLFYLTWGRKFGGIQCFEPNYCSTNFTGFDQMQDSITHSYKMIADSLSDWISPVGEAWRLVLHTTSMVLHSGDESHPNMNGSYLAACVFYSVIFGKSPIGLTFTAGLAADSALILQHAADSVTFGYSQYWNLNNDVPQAAYTLTTASDTLFTSNLSTGATKFRWSFGDGQYSNLFEPVHVYSNPGTYQVKLKSCNDCFCDSVVSNINIVTNGLSSREETERITILPGSSGSGDWRFSNFNGDGIVTFYDILGRKTGLYKVRNGTFQAVINLGWNLWVLLNNSSQPVANGRFFSPQ